MTDIQLLKALADPSRMKIVERLLKHAYCVKALALELGMSESAISQHLKILRDAGLAEGVSYGYYTHYRINRELIQGLIAQLEALLATSPIAWNNGCDMAEAVGCRKKNNTKGGASSC